MPKPNAFPPVTKTTNDLGTWLQQARSRLCRTQRTTDEAGLEASLLAAAVLGLPRSALLAHPEIILDHAQAARLESWLSRLLDGEPLAYLTGRREFYGLSFIVSADVLIPRPETEHLVELALNWLEAHPNRRRVVDVGTGSGCIAIVLARRFPDLTVLGIDISQPALEIARANADLNGVSDRVNLCRNDLLDNLAGPFDFVCANLPYIPGADLETLDVARHEPRIALDGGPDGLDLMRRLLSQLPGRLAPGGLALLEIEYRQGKAAVSLAAHAFPNSQIDLAQDYSGLDRVLQIRT